MTESEKRAALIFLKRLYWDDFYRKTDGGGNKEQAWQMAAAAEKLIEKLEKGE